MMSSPARIPRGLTNWRGSARLRGGVPRWQAPGAREAVRHVSHPSAGLCRARYGLRRRAAASRARPWRAFMNLLRVLHARRRLVGHQAQLCRTARCARRNGRAPPSQCPRAKSARRELATCRASPEDPPARSVPHLAATMWHCHKVGWRGVSVGRCRMERAARDNSADDGRRHISARLLY